MTVGLSVSRLTSGTVSCTYIRLSIVTAAITRARASTLEENLCSRPLLTSALSVSLVVNICVDKQLVTNLDNKVLFILVNRCLEVGMGGSVTRPAQRLGCEE